MSSFSTETQSTPGTETQSITSTETQSIASTEMQSIASTETQSIASTEMQSIASTETQSIAGVEVQKIMPRQTLRGHTNWVTGAVHLPGGRRIITCSGDDSLRLWDLESGAQIGEDWRDEKDTGAWCMALSPDGKTLASGCVDGNVRLWDVESRRVIAILLSPGDTNVIGALAWSTDGKQVLSGSWDGMARVWDVESGVIVLIIQTGRTWVNTVTYSPNGTRIATGSGSAAKIWDVKTGYLLNTLKHNSTVGSLTWTLDGKKFISGSYGPIRIYDTFTWQVIAILEGHLGFINAISLSFNNRLLASTSDDETVRLWNLDTNLPVGPPLQHKGSLRCAAISADGKLLVTGSVNKNAYIWDIHGILKEAGLEDLLPPSSDLMDLDATDGQYLLGFFNDVTGGTNSSRTYGNYHPSSSHHPRPLASSFGSVNILFGRLSLFFRRSQFNTEPQQRTRRVLLSRRPHIVEVAAVKDREVIFTAPLSPEKAQQQTQSHAQESSTTQPASGTNPTTSRPKYPLPVRLLGHLVLFLCCASPRHANGNAQPIQQESQPQCQVHAQASSSQSHSAAPSTSATPTALDSTHTIAPGAAST